MSIVIKKKVSFEFLGEEYKDSYIILKAMSIPEYDAYLDESRKNSGNEKKSMHFIANTLKKQFISGKFNQDGELQDLIKDDIDDLGQALVEVFQIYTGQILPKVPEQS